MGNAKIKKKEKENDTENDIENDIENDTENNIIIRVNYFDKFIEENQIIAEREAIIKEAKEKLFLKREDAILVMIYYKWDLDKLDNWYDSPEENKVKVGIELSEKTRKKLDKNIPSNRKYCLICEEEEKNNNFRSLNCKHQFCINCWEEYLKEKLKYPLEALYANCPQKGCTCKVYENFYSEILKDKNSKIKLEKAKNKNFIDRNDDIKQCPNEKCNLYIKSNNHYPREIVCLCGTSFCYKCSKESHSPCTCETIKKWDELKKKVKYVTNEEKDFKWIEANAKECPNCHLIIERSYGCNYMLCDTKVGGCGKAFCYICGEDWDKHTKDHFNCNKYKIEMEKKRIANEKLEKIVKDDIDLKQLFSEEKDILKKRKKYERFKFYYIRYRNYEKSINECNKNLRENLNEKISLLNAMHNLDIIKLKFITSALETLIKAIKNLKNSYVLGYFIKDNDKKDAFENYQGILEYNTENLYEILVYRNLSTFIDLDSDNFITLFSEYEKSLETFTDITEKYRKEFMDDIENKFNLDLDNDLLK